MEFEMKSTVIDRVTGMSGIVTGAIVYADGGKQTLVQVREIKKGVAAAPVWIGNWRLEQVER